MNTLIKKRIKQLDFIVKDTRLFPKKVFRDTSPPDKTLITTANPNIQCLVWATRYPSESKIVSQSESIYLESLSQWISKEDGCPIKNKITARDRILKHLQNPQSVRNIDLSHLQLVTPPPLHHLTHLQYLDLSNNSISHLSSDTFENLIQLKILTLSQNNLSTIDPLAFSDLFRLQSLNLSFNLLSEIEEATFRHTKKLEHLYLSNNSFTTLRDHYFRDLKELYTLNLNHNQLSTIESNSLSEQVNLRLLYLQNNLISELSNETVLNLFKLNFLDISQNLINRLNWTKQNHFRPTVYIPDNPLDDDFIQTIIQTNGSKNLQGVRYDHPKLLKSQLQLKDDGSHTISIHIIDSRYPTQL